MGEKDAIEQESGIIIEVDDHRDETHASADAADRIEAVADEAATGDTPTDHIVNGNGGPAGALADEAPAPEDGVTAADPSSDRTFTDHLATDDDVAKGVVASPATPGDAGADASIEEGATTAAVSEAPSPPAAVSGDATATDLAVEDGESQGTAIDKVRSPTAASEVVDVVPDTIAEAAGAADVGAAAAVVAEAATIDAAAAGGLSDGAAAEDLAGEGATDHFEPPARASAELKAILEALIFASPEPLSLKALTKLLDSEPKEDVATALVGLKEDYERPGGLQLVEVAGGYQIVTRHDLHEWVRRLFHERSTQKLSAQALETLAVVAYRQPITAVEITEIRGVNTSGVLNTLLERHLIKIVGRKAVVGRPFMYSTTKEFLIRFGLNDLTDLPRVEDMIDALGLEAPLLVEQAPLEDQLPLEEPDTESEEGLSSEADGELGEPDEPEDPETRGGPEGSVH